MTDFTLHNRRTGKQVASLFGFTWRDERGNLNVRFDEKALVAANADVAKIEVRHPMFDKPRFLTWGHGDTDGKGNAFLEFLLTDDLGEAKAGWDWTD